MTPRETFRPHERIKDPADFRRAFDRRRSVSDDVLIVYGVENGLDHPRLGISVSRKKVRRATARNRIKRLIREAFRLGKAEMPPGIDLVVLPARRRADLRRGPAIAAGASAGTWLTPPEDRNPRRSNPSAGDHAMTGRLSESLPAPCRAGSSSPS